MEIGKLHCNVCESADIETHMTKEAWEIVRCRRCGLSFVKNIPTEEELAALYGHTFFEDGQKSPGQGVKLDENPTYANARKRIDSIIKIGPAKGRMLDVGCGTGIFLKAASPFYECSGLDVSGYATEFAVKRLGVDARKGTIFDFSFEPKSIDVITMWDVIEHVRDPDSYIRKISDIIAPGGLLVLSTGNVDSLMFRIQRSNWHLLIPPQHLFYFNKSSITFLLAKHEFNIVKVEHRGQYTNIGYIMEKMKRLHTRSKMIPLMDAVVKSLTLNKLNIYLNLFDVMTVYATRCSKSDLSMYETG
ncbi:MAG: class I SAM-dependent methyltransferase [Deltaproteobacteria bacterium]